MGKSEFPPGWAEQEVIEWVQSIIDEPVDGWPNSDRSFVLRGALRGVAGVAIIRYSGRWMIITAYPDEEDD